MPSAFTPDHEPSGLPEIAALFLIRFDQRIGYTIAWQRAIDDLELSGAVEYKSLPSGLHNVKEDLIYFTHAGYAGVGAFRSEDGAESERNARFVSVGVLVPRGGGKFGRGWLHADEMRRLADAVLRDSGDVSELEVYWEQNKLGNRHATMPDHRRDLSGDAGKDNESEAATSQGTATDQKPQDGALSSSHPVLSTMDLLDTFGPLIFPLYRAALLRKRVLLITRPPLLLACNYVYILSILASIPPVVLGDLPNNVPSQGQPLFTVGVHDIPMLQEMKPRAGSDPNAVHDESGQDDVPMIDTQGWIACTSDELLTTKSDLSDVRVKLTPSTNATGGSHHWPTLSTGSATIRATQRDLRRYKALRHGLQMEEEGHASTELPGDDDAETLLPQPAPERRATVAIPSEDQIVEDLPWAGVVYNSLLWWASAGERSAELEQEYEQDGDLLAAAEDVWSEADAYTRRAGVEGQLLRGGASSGGEEMAVVEYFHRLTGTMLTALLDVVESADAGVDGGDGGAAGKGRVVVRWEDMVGMGLDRWSRADREFVVELAMAYLGREVEVQGPSVECCGVRIY